MSANPIRGEVSVRLGDKDVVLRPTFEALCLVEQDLNEGILPVLNRMRFMQSGIRELTVIVHRCAGAAPQNGKAATYAELGKAIMQAGMFTVWPAVSKMLSDALTSHDEDPNAQAATGEAQTAPATAASPGAAS